jgi:hypothetical protein
MSIDGLRRVMVESPYRGTPSEVRKNTAYAKLAMLDSIRRGEAPFAMHLLYTQILHDEVPEERQAGIYCGLRWLEAAELIAVYADYGVTDGMQKAIDFAKAKGIPVEQRRII